MDIVKLQGDTKYWVVRAGNGGNFLEHFHQNSIVAIGHMDSLNVVSSGYITENEIPLIEKGIREREKSLLPDDRESLAQLTKRISTVRTFITELCIGDVVITPKRDTLLIGTITSEPYIQRDKVKSLNLSGEYSSKEMDYCLRRKIEWGNFENKETLPWKLRESLGSSQAIFRLDQHKEILEHWLYSIFINDEGLHFSTRIDAHADISQYHVTEFQRTVQKLELIADLIANDRIELTGDSNKFLDDIEELYLEYGMNSMFSLTTKQSFSSPGNIWSSFPLFGITQNKVIAKKKAYALALLVQLSYGNVMAANLEDSQLTNEQVVKIEELAKIIKVEGNFGAHQKVLDASLEKRRKQNENYEKEDVPKNKKVIFPDVDKEGDVGQ